MPAQTVDPRSGRFAAARRSAGARIRRPSQGEPMGARDRSRAARSRVARADDDRKCKAPSRFYEQLFGWKKQSEFDRARRGPTTLYGAIGLPTAHDEEIAGDAMPHVLLH